MVWSNPNYPQWYGTSPDLEHTIHDLIFKKQLKWCGSGLSNNEKLNGEDFSNIEHFNLLLHR